MSYPSSKTAQNKRIHIKLDMALLDPENLKDEMLFESAMSVLEGHLGNPAVSKEKLLQDILDVPNLFELFVSGKLHFGTFFRQ